MCDRYLVPPFLWEDHDDEQLSSLPEFGEIEGLPEMYVEGDINDDPVEDGDGGTSTAAGEEETARLRITSQLLTRWLRGSTGPIAQSTRVILGVSIGDLASEQCVTSCLAHLHGVSEAECYRDGVKLGTLTKLLLDQGAISSENPNDVFGVAVATNLLHTELRQVLHDIDVDFVEGGCPHANAKEQDDGGDPMETERVALQAALGEGTRAAPFPMPGPVNRVPLSDLRAPGHVSAAFPTLFPFGFGTYADKHSVELSWTQWSQHVMHHYDGRFAKHSRFRYYVLNTHERDVANRQAQLFVEHNPHHLTVGEVRNLSKEGREEVQRRISRFSATLRNTPAFFTSRRQELFAMIEQLGDPHVFATNSHADTHCPYLHAFIVAWANIEPGSSTDPFAAGLSKDRRYKRRLANLVAYPHLAATFFHHKTEAYIEHICVGILGATAYWNRYEWQSRGSTHAHYFLWLHGTPDLSFLDRWTEEALQMALPGGDGAGDGVISAEQMDAIVTVLNDRALCSAQQTMGIYADGSAHPTKKRTIPLDAALEDFPPLQTDDCDQAAQAAEWWEARACRWNAYWRPAPDNKPDREDGPGVEHAASRCAPCTTIEQSTVETMDSRTRNELESLRRCPETTGGPGAPAPHELVEHLGAVRNFCCRHTHCSNYCLRKRKDQVEPVCRFEFPHKPREVNDVAYFYCEAVEGGVRWRLYLPLNDPLMNVQNLWQAASQGANCDFKPLIDHFSAVEYATKYATKAEKSSVSADAMFNEALNRVDAKGKTSEDSAHSIFASCIRQRNQPPAA
jgi:hypothetical protein